MPNCAAVKAAVRLETIIGQVVPLTRHGHWLSGRCPFHADRHPSLIVWPATQTWKCMTCSPVRDDVIGFVARWRQCSTAEALQWLRQAAPLLDSPPPRVRPAGETPIAPIAARHATYTALLAAWGLVPAHQTGLARRGLTRDTIIQAGFASARPGRAPVAPAAPGVPGFVETADGWRVMGPAGIAIPVRDVAGRIQALHIRTAAAGPGKYRWLSTPGRPGGAASGAPIHVARGHTATIWITEGPLKAEIARQYLGDTVLGVPGAGAWHGVPDLVAAFQPRRVILAFDRDADPATRAAVTRQTARLAATLQAQGWPVAHARWTGPKGLDDALVAGVALLIT